MSEVIVPPLPGSPVVSLNDSNGFNGSQGSNGTHESTVVNESNGNHETSNLKGPVNPPLTYIDPTADTSLVSKEGRIFKMESYILKAASPFFRDHLTSETYKGEPIKIPASSQVIKAWLDLAHMHNRPPKMIWRIREDLLKLSDHLGSRVVSERALMFLHSAVENDPWEVFTLASQKNNVGLAKSALKSLGEIKEAGGEVHGVLDITPKIVEGVAMPYLLGIYVAALKVKEKNGSNGGSPHGSINGSVINGHNGFGGHDAFGGGEIGWQAIAEKFVPIVG